MTTSSITHPFTWDWRKGYSHALTPNKAIETDAVFRQDPNHRSLRFKPVHPTDPVFSVRVTAGCRAVGVRTGEEIVWFWIGTHAAYERLLAQRRPKA